MKKKKKDKNKLDLFTKTKRIKEEKPNKTKRIKTVKSPFKIIIRDWGTDITDHKQMELNEDSKLEIHIDNCLYTVSINKKNRCLQFGTNENHLFLQPISIHSFLVKAHSKN